MVARQREIPVPRRGSGPPASTRWLALAVLCVSLLIVNLDNTVLNVALPTLVRDLRATSSQLQWIVDAYALVFGGLLLVAGSLADRVGRKRTFLAGLAVFVAWERASSHPMLNLAFFRNRDFSGAISSVGLAMFGLVGSLFLLTQFLQFNLGYPALQAGLRMLPVAAALAVIAPLSAVAVRLAGTKLTVAGGLLLIAAGFWQISQATVTWTYTSSLPGMIMIGIGAALVIPSATASVMGSLPRSDTGVGSATNSVSIQIGGALGVAVIGSLLSTRYQDRMTSALAPHHLPHTVENIILGSIGGAQAIAVRTGGVTGKNPVEHSAIPPMTRRQRRPAHLVGPGAALAGEAGHHPRLPLSGT